MQQHKLAAALGVALAAHFSVAIAAQPDPNRVLVTAKAGASGRLEQFLLNSGGKVHHRFRQQGVVAVTLPAHALKELRNNPNVQSVERDYPRYPMAQTVPYGITRVQAPSTVAAGADGTGIKVCVIDSGINAAHEDFAGVAMTGYASPGQDWSVDTCGHGTHVAGTIAATDNTVGVVGVSPGKVSLHVIKVFDGQACGWSYASTLIDAANRCGAAGAKVINMSLGGGGPSTAERDAFANLLANGVLSIAAAGNSGNSTLSYPASYDAVMSVAATDDANVKAGFSQFNAAVDIAAPGVNVQSTYPTRSAALSVGLGNYEATVMTNSVQAQSTAALVDGGLCDAADVSVNWSGKVVLCQRGAISFFAKVNNVTSGGGVAAVIYNNVAGMLNGTLGDGNTSTIPAIGISQADGQALAAGSIGATATVSSVPEFNISSYAFLSGTSMATPHTAGVAALVWSANPEATPAQVRRAMVTTAIDLGAAGRDNDYGWGLVQSLAATQSLLDATLPHDLAVRSYNTLRGRTFQLTWVSSSAAADIYRDNVKVGAVSNGFTYTDYVSTRAHGTFTFKVCNAGSTQACSASVVASY